MNASIGVKNIFSVKIQKISPVKTAWQLRVEYPSDCKCVLFVKLDEFSQVVPMAIVEILRLKSNDLCR
jgi:hypothetical protein